MVDALQVVRPVDRRRHPGVQGLDRGQPVARGDVLGAELLAVLEVVPDEVLGQRPVGAVAAHRGLPHVPVGVDHAGHHDAAAGVDLLGALGHVQAGPTAAIRSSTTRTSASVSTVPASSMVSTVPPRRTTGRPGSAGLGVAHGSSWTSSSRFPDGCPHQRRAVRWRSPWRAAGACQGAPRRAPRPVDSALRRRQRLRDADGRSSADSRPRGTDARSGAQDEHEPRGTAAGTARARSPGCSWPTSPGSWPAPTARCCWPTSAPRWSRWRAPAATTPAPGRRRSATGVSTYYLGVNRNKRSVALDLKDPGDVAVARELARRADVLVENFKPGGLARFGLDYDAVAAINPGVVYASISGFGSGPGGAALPGYDLIVQAISGFMSLTGDPDGEPYRAGVAALRRHGRPARHHRRPLRAQPAARDRPRAARRGQPAVLGALGPGQPDQRLRRRRRGPVPDGQQPPEPVPLRAAALRRRRADRHRRQRRAVPQAVRGARRPGAGRGPAVRRNEDRTANRDELRPLLVERLRTRAKMEWFRDIIGAGVPCGPINTIDQGVAFAEEVGLDPVVTRRRGGRRRPLGAQPDHLLGDRGRATGCRRRTLDEHGAEIRRWLAEPARRRSRHEPTACPSRPPSAPPPPTRSGCSART